MNVRLISVQLVVLAFLAVFYFAVVRPDSGTRDLPSTGDEVLVGDFPVERVRSIKVSKWNKDTKSDDVIELARIGEDEGDGGGTGNWVVTSSYGYPADTSKVLELIDMVREMKSGPVRAQSEKLWASFELDGPQATIVTFMDGHGGRILGLFLGKTNFSMASLFNPTMDKEKKDDSSTYVRTGDSPKVYEVPGSHSVMADPSQWLDLEITKEDSGKIGAILLRGENGEIFLVRKPKAPEEGENKGGGDKKQEYEWFFRRTIPGRGEVDIKAKKWPAQKLVNSVASLSGSGVAEPMEIGENESDTTKQWKKKYGFDSPALTVKVWIEKEGKQPEVKSLAFGRVKGKTGENETIYVYQPQKRSSFMEKISAVLGEGETKTTQKVHVYTLPDHKFTEINMKPRDLKEEAPEAKDAFLKSVDWDDLTGFDIVKGASKIRVRKMISEVASAKYGSEIWASEDHWSCPILTDKAESFLKELKELKQGDSAVPGESPEVTGLGEKTATAVVLFGPGGKESARFTVGAACKEGGKEFTYMALPGKDSREVPEKHSFSAQANSWLDLKILFFEPDDVEFFELDSSKAGFVRLTRQHLPTKGKYVWFIQKPNASRTAYELHSTEEEKVNNVVTLLSRLTAKSLAKPIVIPAGKGQITQAQVKENGFEKLALRVVVALKTGQQVPVYVAKALGEDSYFGCTPEGRRITPWEPGESPMKIRVWHLNKFIVEALLKGEDHFRKKEKKEEKGEKKGEGEKEGEGEGKTGGEEKGEEPGGKKEAGEEKGEGETEGEEKKAGEPGGEKEAGEEKSEGETEGEEEKAGEPGGEKEAGEEKSEGETEGEEEKAGEPGGEKEAGEEKSEGEAEGVEEKAGEPGGEKEAGEEKSDGETEGEEGTPKKGDDDEAPEKGAGSGSSGE